MAPPDDAPLKSPTLPSSSQASIARPASQYAPANPSTLRESHLAQSPDTNSISSSRASRTEEEEGPGAEEDNDNMTGALPSTRSLFDIEEESIQPGDATGHSRPVEQETERDVAGKITEPTRRDAHVRTRLLEGYQSGATCGLEHCNHGTFSPRITGHRSGGSSISSLNGFGGVHPETGSPGSSTGSALLGDAVADGLFGKPSRISTTKWLAMKHGVRNRRIMYLSYYFPFLNWIRQYRLSWFVGDLIAALTICSFYLPMALSYAANLGHIPPIQGLYAFALNPLVYALFGSCPQMVVGPEAAGSLLVGSVVRASIANGDIVDDDGVAEAQLAGVVTGMAGAIILVAGLTRLGFLDNVLSRPFLRGFISAIGFVIFIDQLIPELGLSHVANYAGADHGSCVDKIVFLVRNIKESHTLTTVVSLVSFVIIMFLRQLKKKLQPRYPSVAYFPDRFLVVLFSAIFTWKFGWDKKGLEILGDIKSAGGSPFQIRWPFQFEHMHHVRSALSTSFLIALLGFFESSVAAKSLGEGQADGIKGINLSANRELVALGLANLAGGCFMALPAFGGYGRSKVNASTGGKTPMSSIFISIITVICILFVLPYFYYLPKAVLSAMISVVAYSLIEECPHDILFFLRIRGYTELSLMLLIFLSTIFYSLSLGIALGVGLSILIIIRHSTQPRIQILGRKSGTSNSFENAEDAPESVEFIEGCLIVKIPEPLTFANTGDIRNRLRRLEFYGTNRAHPALPRVRDPAHNKNIIFDVHGVTSIDGSGTQVLAEIVEGYVNSGTRVFFCRLPRRRGTGVYSMFERAGIVDMCGGSARFVDSVDEALRLTEVEDLIQEFGGERSRDEDLMF